MTSTLKTTAQFFKTLSDPTRLRILALLEQQTLCVMDIVTVLKLPQPTVSRHLATLQKNQLIQSQKKGLWHFYTLRTHSELSSLLKTARTAPELRQDQKTAATLARKGGCCPK